MPTAHKQIAILGSTGSIGRNALEVIRAIDGLTVFGLTGHSNTRLLCEQVAEFKPQMVVVTDADRSTDFSLSESCAGGFRTGSAGLVELATHAEVDMVLAAIVGRAGLESTLAAVESGTTVALANKETLVMAGQLVMQAAAKSNATILPVDSEHSAVFQALRSGKSSEVQKIVLTASGGPFRDLTLQQLNCVTVEQALAHPTWSMGKKISVDSATMMNKALEIIEARWLFGMDPDRIGVTVHPQSIIHSLVEFVDGSVIAQLSPPDMKLPIQYALTYPDRQTGPAPRLDLNQALDLQFAPPDFDRFPALALGYEVARAGGTAGAVLNAANESAVAAFLAKTISFTDIVTACREILDAHQFEPHPTLEQLLNADQWARKELNKWISC